MSKTKHAVPGSERAPIPGARLVGAANPDERLEVTVRLRARGGSDLDSALNAVAASRAKAGGTPKYLTREEYAQSHGADPAELDKIVQFAQAHKLDVVERNIAERKVVLSGTVAAFTAAFDVELNTYEHHGGTYRGRVGHVHVPIELKDAVEGVFGLDDRPQAKPHFRLNSNAGNILWHAAPAPLTPPQVAALYDFPKNATGAKQCIAIIELGGGYRPADLETYFSALGVSPVPKVTNVSVDHAKNHPTGNPDGPDGEVMLDIEVAGAVAPGASIVVYFAPNTDRGFLDAITAATHDTRNKPSVISISWGGPESSWTAQAMQAFDQAFKSAAALGITVCCASGDDGSSDGVNDGADHVDFPASSSYALACGGTRLVAKGTTITSEAVWNDGASGGATGGGVSAQFPRPSWQADAKVPPPPTAGGGRGVPDVSGDADPVTGYRVRVDGQDTVIGGTSAVAPLWAGLIALINEVKKHPVGFINPRLYSNTSALHDITKGNNGSFVAGPGWDACTGLGSPDGNKLVAIL